MIRHTLAALATLASPLALAVPTQAQETPSPLELGAVAPDFALPGATRYGILNEPVRLSNFEGKTVVLAFFFKARTRG
jgi:hypothetical protein